MYGVQFWMYFRHNGGTVAGKKATSLLISDTLYAAFQIVAFKKLRPIWQTTPGAEGHTLNKLVCL